MTERMEFDVRTAGSTAPGHRGTRYEVLSRRFFTHDTKGLMMHHAAFSRAFLRIALCIRTHSRDSLRVLLENELFVKGLISIHSHLPR